MKQSMTASALLALTLMSLLVGCNSSLINSTTSVDPAIDDTPVSHSPSQTAVVTEVNTLAVEERIEFPPHASSISLMREFAPHSSAELIVGAVEGQQLMGGTYGCSGLSETVYGAEDGLEIVGSGSPGIGSWAFRVYATQDYVIRLENGSTPQRCTLYFAFLKDIVFAPGTASASIAGDIAGLDGNDVYVLDTSEGQTVAITVTSSSNDVCLSVVDPSDLRPVAQSVYDIGTTGWSGIVRQVRARCLVVVELCERVTSGNASYTLEVNVTD